MEYLSPNEGGCGRGSYPLQKTVVMTSNDDDEVGGTVDVGVGVRCALSEHALKTRCCTSLLLGGMWAPFDQTG